MAGLSLCQTEDLPYFTGGPATPEITIAALVPWAQEEQLGEVVVGSLTRGGAPQKRVQFPSDGSNAKDIKEFLPYVDLGECENMYCADTGVLLDKGKVKNEKGREEERGGEVSGPRHPRSGSESRSGSDSSGDSDS